MMEDPAPFAPVPQKRPLEEDVEPPISTPVEPIRSEASTPLSVRSVQTPSPLKKATPNTTAPSNTQPAKRRKLTQKEKDDQRLEKEAKAKAREEKKAQKEAEDKLKAEQKAQKEDEKQKKIEEREEKKRQKEEEQRQKDEEKAKKERSQMKLNAFFAKPKSSGVSPGKALVESIQNPTAPSASSLPDTSAASTNSAPPSPQKNIVKNAQSDYDRYFLPFNLPVHTLLAPKNAFMEDPVKMEAARTRLDNLITGKDVDMVPVTVQNFISSLPKSGRRGVNTASIIDVIECVNASSEQTTDLTNNRASTSQRPLEMLKEIPMKYIHFGEDVRPPYYGTYTRSYTDVEAVRLARNPLSRLRQDTNYDYDSEAEWDEPEEGEDLDSEGDDDEEEVEDDMDGFLDDEEDPQLKRRLISGDLQSVSSGLCWQDIHGVSRLNDGSGAICTEFNDFKMGFLLESYPHAIDPFSTAYWTPEPFLTVPSVTNASKDTMTINGSMNPPRAPLAQRSINGLLNTLNTPQTPSTGTSSKPAKAKRMIPPEQLPAFKAEIEGKDLTKIGMVEALKKVFPKLPKDAITNTLSVVAARVGPTEKEKRWVCIDK